MIIDQALNKAGEIYRRMQLANRTMLMTSGSPFDGVRRALVASNFAVGQTDVDLKTRIALMAGDGDPEHPSIYEGEYGALLASVAEAAKANFAMVREEVIPTIARYTSIISESLASAETITVSDITTIRYWELPGFIVDSEFHDIVASAGSQPVIRKNGWLSAPATTDAIINYVAYDDSVVGDVRAYLIANMTPEEITAAWQDGFGTGGRMESITDRVNGFNAALLIYGVATHLVDNVPEEIGGAPNYSDYIAWIRSVQALAAFRIAAHINTALLYDDSKILIIGGDTSTVLVYRPSFVKFLSEGGEVEALFGAHHDGGSAYVDDIIRDSERYKGKWRETVAAAISVNQIFRLDRLRGAVRLAHMKDSADELSSSEKNIRAQNPTMAEVINAGVEEYIGKLRAPDADNIDKIARELVCRYRFGYTDADMILETFETIHKAMPDITPTEIASVAFVRYIVMFGLSCYKFHG